MIEQDMAPTRFFHEIDGNVHALLDSGPFRYEHELQRFFEKYLHTLTGVEFLASEYSTGPRHGRRIDTLGIDGAGRPVVVEYKRRQDQNVITQGLDYLVWLEDHQAEFRELVRTQLGDGRVTDIDFGAARLLCIAAGFPRQDQIAAAQIRRPIELIRYRRYGDAYVALEWVYGAAPESVPQPPDPLPKRVVVEDPDYSINEPWGKANEASRTLFRELKTLVESFGNVRTTAFKTEMVFQCMVGTRKRIVAVVRLRVRSALRVSINEKHLSAIPLEDGFTHLVDHDRWRVIAIRGREHIRRAEPLLRAAYDNLHQQHAAARRGFAKSKAEFLESCDEHGRAVFARILDFADHKGMSVRWGTSGFTMGVEAGGTRVVICYVYPPGTFWSALTDRAGIQKKTAAPAEAVAQLQQAAERTGLFEPAVKRQSLKCVIDRPFTEEETNALVAWCESVAQAIREHAVPGGPARG